MPPLPANEVTEIRQRMQRLENNQQQQAANFRELEIHVRDSLTRIEGMVRDIREKQAVQVAEQRALARATRRQSIGGLGALAAVLVELARRYLGQ